MGFNIMSWSTLINWFFNQSLTANVATAPTRKPTTMLTSNPPNAPSQKPIGSSTANPTNPPTRKPTTPLLLSSNQTEGFVSVLFLWGTLSSHHTPCLPPFYCGHCKISSPTMAASSSSLQQGNSSQIPPTM
ncbi:hypothetical protein ACHAW6_012560 [Cyclotella cf. meneghiniana]